jgi:two-component system phosphate regulon sensor histidine kinase PhoR
MPSRNITGRRAAVAGEAREFLKTMAERAGGLTGVPWPGVETQVPWRRAACGSCLTNLMENGIKYTSPAAGWS